MFRSLLMLAAVLPAVASAQSAFTDASNHRASDTFAIRSCSDAAEREVRSRNPMAGSVDTGDATASSTSPDTTDIAGTGQVTDGSHATRSFSFRCSYDVRTGNTSGVTVTL